MRTLQITLLFFISVFTVNAQEVKQNLLNRYFEVTTNVKEAFFYRLSQPFKGYWAYTDYDSKDRVVRTGYFTDSNFTTQIGPHSFFWEGKPMYKGKFVDGKPSGYWYFYNTKGEIYDSLHYVEKTTAEVKNSFPEKNDEAEKNKTAMLQNEHMKKDSSVVFATVEKEASFPGGDKGWSKYLTKQLSMPDLIMAINRPQRMTVEVQFVVCNDGEVCSVEAINSSSPLLDIMAVNAIRKGPKWEPAFQNNKNVKAWRRQKISFIIPED
ncbi:energy transducer TonB [Lacibacter cauensis]|nr:energy transducer TonB [Lacibacter cauensis]